MIKIELTDNPRVACDLPECYQAPKYFLSGAYRYNLYFCKRHFLELMKCIVIVPDTKILTQLANAIQKRIAKDDKKNTITNKYRKATKVGKDPTKRTS